MIMTANPKEERRRKKEMKFLFRNLTCIKKRKPGKIGNKKKGVKKRKVERAVEKDNEDGAPVEVKIRKVEMDEEEVEDEEFARKLDNLKTKKVKIDKLFQIMCEMNSTFINFLIEKDVKLINDSFSCIAKNMPKVISFKNKRTYFKKSLKKGSKGEIPLRLNIRRKEIFMDCFNNIMNKTPSQLKGKLQIKFNGEDGDDAGGLAREWFLCLSKEIFNPNYALFKHSDSEMTYQPNPHSHVNPDHLRFFKFVGRIVGQVRYSEIPLHFFPLIIFFPDVFRPCTMDTC